MVSFEVISSNKNLRCIKTLLGKNSQETHTCMHKETGIRMFHEMLFGTTAAKIKTTSMFIKKRKDNKM